MKYTKKQLADVYRRGETRLSFDIAEAMLAESEKRK